MRSKIQSNREACVIFGDTVLDKRFSSKIELVHRQYSGNEHRVIRGILAIWCCIYVNAETGYYSVIDYRIYATQYHARTLGFISYTFCSTALTLVHAP